MDDPRRQEKSKALIIKMRESFLYSPNTVDIDISMGLRSIIVDARRVRRGEKKLERVTS
jgi:hypothetical protein